MSCHICSYSSPLLITILSSPFPSTLTIPHPSSLKPHHPHLILHLWPITPHRNIINITGISVFLSNRSLLPGKLHSTVLLYSYIHTGYLPNMMSPPELSRNMQTHCKLTATMTFNNTRANFYFQMFEINFLLSGNELEAFLKLFLRLGSSNFFPWE